MPPNQYAILLIPSKWPKTNRLLGGFLDTIVLLDARTLSQVAAVLCFIGHRPFFAWNGAKPPKVTVFAMSFANLGVQYETELYTLQCGNALVKLPMQISGVYGLSSHGI